ncbi:hypothetical protein, partial [Bacillus paramycoides]|uniref:hypothetical protein n=1 Tax=Bacillus paramycoides TaxID=2026194 RepID=UPI003D2479DB
TTAISICTYSSTTRPGDRFWITLQQNHLLYIRLIPVVSFLEKKEFYLFCLIISRFAKRDYTTLEELLW